MDYLSLCLICKDENDYLPEWLDYHILMGVDRFYIYDNESEISLRESLKDYIERGWVVVVAIPGKARQLYAYDHCLQTFGSQTFWMGFIDTDEFLVPKASLDLKALLKDYEAYGGLAVSSLFFGSNGHQIRPPVGQIAAYTRRTHATFIENELIKSIIQPGLVLMPNSPHDFTYKEGNWCVNEDFLRVDGQRFPNSVKKIQVNHYYCRSEQEIDLKLSRGNSGAVAWPRKRFEVVNQLATFKDTSILQNMEIIFQKAGIDFSTLEADDLPEKIEVLAHIRRRALNHQTNFPREAVEFRAEFTSMEELKAKTREALTSKQFEEARRLTLLRIKIVPQNINLYFALTIVLLDLGDPDGAWQALSQAWQLSPNNYVTLGGMTFYFLRVENFIMAENTCRLLLEQAPHDMAALGMLTHSLIGQGRYEEALKVGIPVVELSAQVGELPDGMGVFLVRKMADYLLEKKDYDGAVHLWEVGVRCQPGEISALLELGRVLLLKGDTASARRYLTQAQSLSPQNEAVLALLKQVESPASGIYRKIRRR